jgi:hypothetical protein
MATTMKLIAKNVLGSDTATVTFSSIPGTGYTDLLMVTSTRGTNSSQAVNLVVSFNSSTSNFTYRELYGSGSSAASELGSTGRAGLTCGNTSTASTFGSTELYIPNYAGSTNKSYSVTSVSETNASAALMNVLAGLWSNTAAITSIGVSPNAGSWKSGSSFFLFGITKA